MLPNRPILKSISIEGFKSIKSLQDFSLTSINLMIGSNGAGKSNLISFFRMLSWSVNAPLDFQEKYVNREGRASGLLFNGIKTTTSIKSTLIVETAQGNIFYRFQLGLVGTENLIYIKESIKCDNDRADTNSEKNGWISINELGSPSSNLFENSANNTIVKDIVSALQQIRVYQFHDTSRNAYVRQAWNVNDGSYLKENGENLGSFLFNIKSNFPEQYLIIISYIRRVIPNFDDFVLEVQGQKVELKWKEEGSEYVFSAFQASDGMLRFWCLVALLGQPSDRLPSIIFIDEPELGLHPDAISFVAELMKKASSIVQLFISTQSSNLLDHFSPEDVIVVDRPGRESHYKRLDTNELQNWLQDFDGLGNVWDLNLIGGKI